MSEQLDFSKPMITKKGHPARLISANINSDFSVAVAVKNPTGEEIVYCVLPNGSYCTNGQYHERDIVNIVRTKTITKYIIIYIDGTSGTYNTKPSKQALNSYDVFAYKEITFTVKEGKGLTNGDTTNG